MALDCDGQEGHALCVRGCGRFAFVPRFRDCCQGCPIFHTNQCGHRQPPLCRFGCGRLANRPRHTSCCRRCPTAHTGQCDGRQGLMSGQPEPLEDRPGTDDDWVWVAAEHGLFLERGAIIGLPLPPGTLTTGDRGVMPRASGAVFICRLPRREVRGFRRRGPAGTFDIREGLRRCFGAPDTGGGGQCEGCGGHLCPACLRECRHCTKAICDTCLDHHDCTRDRSPSD